MIFQIFCIIILVTKSHGMQTTYICMYDIYNQLVFRPFAPKRFGKTRLVFINCLKACNCCTLMDIIACYALPKTSLLFQKSSNYLYYSNPYFPRINRNIRAWQVGSIFFLYSLRCCSCRCTFWYYKKQARLVKLVLIQGTTNI